jgi:multiple sugar transport system substrate-binding protein
VITGFSFRALLIAALLAVLTGCDGGSHQPQAGSTLRVWAHAGQAAERAVLEQQVQRFEQHNPDLSVVLSFLPERNYNAQVQSAALAGDLPDVLELDGPYLYNYVWQQKLQPLDRLLPAGLQEDLLPSLRVQGSYRGRLYAVGSFDSGLALYARRSLLEQAGLDAAPAHPDDALSAERFEQLLQALAAQDADGAVLDLKLNYPDEWFSYAFSPWLQSAGADLIERRHYRRAQDTLNGAAAVGVMRRLQDWLHSGRVDPNIDDAAFVSGRVALSLAGHWEYARYAAAWGEDLVLMPLPDFGRGSRTGQGSWVWSISADSRHAADAARFLTFLLQSDEVLATSAANGAVPGRHSAVQRSPLYRAGAPLHLFVVQLSEGYAVARPKTPAYPVISAAFRRAFDDIRHGAAPQAALDQAVARIERDLEDNRGYPFPDPP